MKKFFCSFFMAFFAIATFAQKDVTTFLGIPVDGFKSEMKQKLISKGFATAPGEEFLQGEFNGTDVHVYIATNNNKVYRIMICDANNRNEADIKIRFNRLIEQFKNNKRYVSLEDYTISDDVDISYEMTVHNKNFDALFYQAPDMEKIDTLAVMTAVYEQLAVKYTEEQLANPTEEIQQESQQIATRYAMDLFFKKPVWFRISRYINEYYITMFYDNEYNHANGEDL